MTKSAAAAKALKRRPQGLWRWRPPTSPPLFWPHVARPPLPVRPISTVPRRRTPRPLHLLTAPTPSHRATAVTAMPTTTATRAMATATSSRPVVVYRACRRGGARTRVRPLTEERKSSDRVHRPARLARASRDRCPSRHRHHCHHVRRARALAQRGIPRSAPSGRTRQLAAPQAAQRDCGAVLPALAAADRFHTGSCHQFATGYFLRRDATQWFWHQYTTSQSQREQITASPLRASAEQLAGLPPALVITAEADVLRDEGEAYASKLRQAGVPVVATRYLGIIHDFVMLNALHDTNAAGAAIAQAVDHLGHALGTSS
jgi:alpha/beta hydrolase fold